MPHEGQKDSRSAGALSRACGPLSPSPGLQGVPITICTPTFMGDPRAEARSAPAAQGHRAEGTECLGFEPRLCTLLSPLFFPHPPLGLLQGSGKGVGEVSWQITALILTQIRAWRRIPIRWHQRGANWGWAGIPLVAGGPLQGAAGAVGDKALQGAGGGSENWPAPPAGPAPSGWR